jgi:hypothetical protein
MDPGGQVIEINQIRIQNTRTNTAMVFVSFKEVSSANLLRLRVRKAVTFYKEKPFRCKFFYIKLYRIAEPFKREGQKRVAHLMRRA